MAESLLTLAGVHANIDAYHILQGVDLEVPEGEVTVVLGRNGVGKTTSLRTIIGELSPTRGSISFGGEEIGGIGSSNVSQMGVGYVPEQMCIFLDLTVEENLILAAYGRKYPDKDRLESIFALFPPLEKLLKSRAGVLSGGQKQMLSIARAMVQPRRLVLIDEPTKGLAPAIINSLADSLLSMVAEGVTVLLVEQNLQFAIRVATHARVMDDGRMVHAGLMSEMAQDNELQQSLLGLAAA